MYNTKPRLVHPQLDFLSGILGPQWNHWEGRPHRTAWFSCQLPLWLMTLCVSLGFNLQGIIPCLIQPLINLHHHRYNYKRKYWHNHHVKKEERRVCFSPAFSIAWLSETQRSVRSRRDRHALHPSPRSRNKCRDDPGVLDFLLVKTSDWSMLFLR